MHPSKIKIDSHQFTTNLQAIRNQVGPEVKICLPVKANAYGHGLVEMSLAAEQYVDYLAVSCLEEGKTLVQNAITKPILVFGAFDDEQIPALVAYNLEISIGSLEKATLLSEFCQKLNLVCKVHVKVDTGMNRVGVAVAKAKELIDFALSQTKLELIGVYSHFAASDDPDPFLSEQQIALFRDITAYIRAKKPAVICHLANSGGVAHYPESYFDMVRPGIMSYGYFPGKVINNGPLAAIKPCLSLIARIVYVKSVPKEQGVSYSHRYFTDEVTNIVTIPIGYGDGYRRGLSNIGEVLVDGEKFPIAGSVCMDMLMIDLGSNEAAVGDEAVLIGRQGRQEILLTELAEKLNTISYEVLVGFNERIPRVMI